MWILNLKKEFMRSFLIKFIQRNGIISHSVYKKHFTLDYGSHFTPYLGIRLFYWWVEFHPFVEKDSCYSKIRFYSIRKYNERIT